MPSKYLEPSDRVVRYVPWTKLLKDPDDEEKVVGTLGPAFLLREGETYLSVTWCEYFLGTSKESLRCAAEAIRSSQLDVRPKGHFAVASVGAVSDHMAAGGRKLRVIHERDPDNPAHTAMRGWSNESSELLDRLAEDVWNVVYSKTQIDELPNTSCAPTERGAQP